MENVKFKLCVISDVSYGCGLLTLTVSTKGFNRYSTGLKRIREALENTFNEYYSNMLLTEFYRAESNSFNGDCVVRNGCSRFVCTTFKSISEFYYSSVYDKTMNCVFTVYLRGNTVLSDILLSDGLLSSLFAEDTTSDTSDTTEGTSDTSDTSDTTEDTSDTSEGTSDNTTTICFGSLDDIQIEERNYFDDESELPF